MSEHKPWCERTIYRDDPRISFCTCERRSGEQRKVIDLMETLKRSIEGTVRRTGTDRRKGGDR